MKARAAILFVFALAAFHAAATPPKTLSYQGFLTSSADAPIDAPVPMTFRIYTVPTGGAALWSETQASVAVAKGEFSTVLGLATPIALAFDVPYYLGVTVGADPEMTPRQPLASSAYAFRALALDSAATLPGSILTGTIPVATLPGSQVTGSIDTATLTGSQITGSITTATIPASHVLGSLDIATVPGSQVTGSITSATLPGSQVTGSITTATLPGSHVTGDLSGVGNIVLPNSTASVGNVVKNGTAFLHDFGLGNTFLGAAAGNFTLTGSANTAVGTGALGANTSARDNTAVGNVALAANTTGVENTAVGSQALRNNTSTGQDNTAVGYQALLANTTGVQNTAIGNDALLSNTVGINNIAIGSAALSGTAGATNNLAIGVNAMLDTADGAFNIAVGNDVLLGNGSGSLNTAIGYSAAFLMTGSSNIALGAGAGFSVGGSHNIEIGNSGTASDDHVIRVGDVQTSAFFAGINGVTTGLPGTAVLVDGNGQLGTASSSRTVKEGITDMGEASALLMKLRPVVFHYRNRPAWPLQYGLIAEEVAEVAPDLAARGPDGKIQTVYYQDLPPMLVNEYQKQQRTIEAQRARIDSLEHRLQLLESRLEK